MVKVNQTNLGVTMGTIKQMIAAKKMMNKTKPEKGETKKHEYTETKKIEKTENKKPKVMSKSVAVKKAIAGKDMGKPGKNFSMIAAKAGKEYGSAEAGKKVAGAIFQKMRRKGTL